MTRYKEAFSEGCRLLEAVLPEKRERELEARLLLEHVCGTRLETLLTEPDREVGPEQLERYRELLDRRNRHVPLAYLTGGTEFMGLPFVVSEAVLIPRQDTETLVELAMPHMTGGSRVLDLCTGSGCILLSLLHYSVDCEGVGTDISGEALRVAGQNAQELDLSDRARFYQGDLWEALPETEGGFDLIVSNPPYIATSVIDTLMPEVALAEPRQALDGGPDGLDLIRRIADRAADLLTPGGSIFVEIGSDQGEAATALFEERGYYQVEVHRDLCGLDRVVSAVRSFRTGQTGRQDAR